MGVETKDSKYLIFLSTSPTSIGSALIRRFTLCSWSHIGFYRRSDGWNFSAMNDGKGVAWRGPDPATPCLYLTCPNVDAMAEAAFTQEGKGYNQRAIAGIALGRNWDNPDEFYCSELVLWAAEKAGTPLLNPRFIPHEHITPRDILLSPFVSEVKTP